MTSRSTPLQERADRRPLTVYGAISDDALWKEVTRNLSAERYALRRVGPAELPSDLSDSSHGSHGLPASAARRPVLLIDGAIWESEASEGIPDAVPTIVLERRKETRDGKLPREREDAPWLIFLPVTAEPARLSPQLPALVERARLESELHAARLELRNVGERFESIVERMDEGVVVVDADGVVRFVNPAAERLFGRPADQLTGAPFGFPVVVGENTEIDLVCPRGRIRVVELRAVESSWDGSQAHLITLRDTTERRRAEERERNLAREQAARSAAEAEARRASLLASASDMLFSGLETRAILHGLAGFCLRHQGQYATVDLRLGPGPLHRVAALAPGSTDHRPPWEPERIPLDESPQSPQARVFQSGTSELVETMNDQWLSTFAQSPGHRRYLREMELSSAAVVPLHDRTRILGVLTVGTCGTAPPLHAADRTFLEELGRRAGIALDNARLYQAAADASRAKSDFLAIVSHELRTPLSGIVGYAKLLEEEIPGPLSEEQDEFVGRILKSTSHLMEIIGEILAFVDTGISYDEVDLRYEDLGTILREVSAAVEPLARESGLELRVSYPSEKVTLRTDGPKIRKVLLNLLTNAVKFTFQGQIDLDAGADAHTVRLRVRDTGVGIPEDQIEQIFQPFYQLEDVKTRRAGGLGLGLSIARRFVDLLGGGIEVAARPSGGTAFTIVLPRDVGDETRTAHEGWVPSERGSRS